METGAEAEIFFMGCEYLNLDDITKLRNGVLGHFEGPSVTDEEAKSNDDDSEDGEWEDDNEAAPLVEGKLDSSGFLCPSPTSPCAAGGGPPAPAHEPGLEYGAVGADIAADNIAAGMEGNHAAPPAPSALKYQCVTAEWVDPLCDHNVNLLAEEWEQRPDIQACVTRKQQMYGANVVSAFLEKEAAAAKEAAVVAAEESDDGDGDSEDDDAAVVREGKLDQKLAKLPKREGKGQKKASASAVAPKIPRAWTREENSRGWRNGFLFAAAGTGITAVAAAAAIATAVTPVGWFIGAGIGVGGGAGIFGGAAGVAGMGAFYQQGRLNEMHANNKNK
jgi:hypothetical protein